MKFTIVSGLFAALPAFVTAAPAAPETGLLDRRVTTNDNVFLYPGGLGDPLNGVLGSYPASTLNYLNVDKYQQNKIPLRCKEKAQALYNGSPRCPLSDMYVFDFSWEDAPGRTWTICYCKNSPVALGDIANELGRVPVAMRQRTRNFMFFNAGGGAFAQYGDVTFLGTISPTVVLHEISHTVDGGQLSTSDAWKNAVASDDCWADYYAKSSMAEAWAQVNVLVRYRYGQGVDLIRDLPTEKFGAGLTSECLFMQFWTVVYQTYTEMAAGFDASKTPAADTLVDKL